MCPSVRVARTGTAVVHIGMNRYMDTGSSPNYVAPESSVAPWGLPKNPLTGKPSNSVIPLQRTRRPADMFLLGDKALTSTTWMPIISPDVTEIYLPDLRHNGTAQIALVDGHSASFSLDEVLDQAKHYLWWR